MVVEVVGMATMSVNGGTRRLLAGLVMVLVVEVEVEKRWGKCNWVILTATAGDVALGQGLLHDDDQNCGDSGMTDE